MIIFLGRKIRNPLAGYPPDIIRISGIFRISDFPALIKTILFGSFSFQALKTQESLDQTIF